MAGDYGTSGAVMAADALMEPDAMDQGDGLNEGFALPSDGWVMIEPKGTHVNRAAGVVQIIDDRAIESIVRQFNEQAAQPGYAGMLIDYEHFRHDPSKESMAYGWLMALEARADGIYGRVRWSTTGHEAVTGGEYRYFSTEYNPAECEVVTPNAGAAGAGNGDGALKRLRPMKLSGLSLTNAPNNSQGARPITNSRVEVDQRTPEERQADIDLAGVRHCFARPDYKALRSALICNRNAMLPMVRQVAGERSFGSEVLAEMASGKSAAEAVRLVVNREPGLHQAWLRAGGSAHLQPVVNRQALDNLQRYLGQGKRTFAGEVRKEIAAGRSKSRAIVLVVNREPELHREWLQAGCREQL